MINRETTFSKLESDYIKTKQSSEFSQLKFSKDLGTFKNLDGKTILEESDDASYRSSSQYRYSVKDDYPFESFCDF